MECNLAIKSNGMMSFVKTHMEIEVIILSEKKAGIDRCCMISLKGGI